MSITIVKASEIAKIEDADKRIMDFVLFARTLQKTKLSPSLLILAWDVINQTVSRDTIAMANILWWAHDKGKEDNIPNLALPDIVKLIANHNPDFQPGEEAFVLLDDMVKVKV